MDKIFARTIISVFIALTFSSVAAAQAVRPEPGNNRPAMEEGKDKRSPLSFLGLSPTQIQEMRKIGEESRETEIAARKRFMEAKRNLDAEIYAEEADSAKLQAAIAEYNAAQSAVSEIRFAKEFAIRKILTAEQLAKFRQMRERFEERRANAKPGRIPVRRRQPEQ